MVNRGSRVNLVIAAAQTTIQVPDVVGNLATDANFKLTNAGLSSRATRPPPTSPWARSSTRTPLPD